MIFSQTSRLFILCGAISGFLSVSLGAFAAHSLKQQLSEHYLSVFQTGVTYQFYHALGLMLIGLIAYHHNTTGIKLAGWFMLAGSVVFSGSLYLLSLTGIRWLGMITPLGGLCFLTGWALLAYSIWKKSA